MIKNYPKCKTCKFHGNEENKKICTNTQKISDSFTFESEEDFEIQMQKDDQLEFSYDEGGHFDAGDNFGCIHHEEKIESISKFEDG